MSTSPGPKDNSSTFCNGKEMLYSKLALCNCRIN